MFEPHEIKWSSDKISNLWGYYSKNQHFSQQYFTKNAGCYVIHHLSRKIKLSGLTLLDYGSGPGYFFEHLIRLNVPVKYSALDFSEISVNILRQKYCNENSFDAAYCAGNVPNAIFNKFDVLLCCEVIEHLDDEKLSAMISEIKSLLKGGGHIYLSTPNNEDLDALKLICPECGCIFHKWQHVRSWTKNTLKSFMENNGFETLSIEEILLASLWVRSKFIIKNIFNRKIKKPQIVYWGRLK
jgi:2-polyprenyl-3-methyl-5-hydroxy-6-metoxy-1,4-benzoquinol methylase